MANKPKPKIAKQVAQIILTKKQPKPNAKLLMSDFFELNRVVVKKQIKDNLIGNYAFGSLITKNGKRRFNVCYVGRSDTNLRKEIIQQGLDKKVDSDGNPIHTHFKFSVADSIIEAYEKECKNYHDFGGMDCLENERHPKRPTGFSKSMLPCSELGCKD